MQQKLIRFFRECYQQDNRSQNLLDIFSSKHQLLHLHDEVPLDTSVHEWQLPIDSEHGNKLSLASATYKREKQLVIGLHFIVGSLANNSPFSKGKTKKICAPIFLLDAECPESINSFTIDSVPESISWNFSLLSQLFDDSKKADAFIAENPVIDTPSSIEEICLRLNEALEADTSYPLARKTLSSGDTKKSLPRIPKGKLGIIAGVSSLLTERSLSTRGIISELSALEEAESCSEPLKHLDICNTENNPASSNSINIDNVPGILSAPQKDIIQASSDSPLSLLIGPPGTGKSYTIASLALERFMQGESVLIVSQNEHAVDVIKEKLVSQLGLSQTAAIRAGSKNYHRELKRHLDNVIKDNHETSASTNHKRSLRRLKRTLTKKEKSFVKLLTIAEENGKLLSDAQLSNTPPSLLSSFKMWRSARSLNKNGLLQESLLELQELSNERESLLSKHINSILSSKIRTFLGKRDNKQQLVKFRASLGARTSQKQENLFSAINFASLLETMPIWLCSLNALHKSLPLDKELFDLVIIDEATQCDIASCLPALQRAKRALVVGDPKQLRHISFLSRSRQELLRDNLKLDPEYDQLNYRDHSMIDLAIQSLRTNSSHITLNEHYRSAPEIIRFSNEYFYESKLRLMTEKPATTQHKALELIEVEGGSRKDGVNKVEAQAVVDKIKQQVEEQRNVPDELKLSIGVVSFFKDQAQYIQDKIFDEISLNDITLHNLRSGTPYAFQGEERGIVLISCSVDSDTSSSTYTYLNRHDVFNVSITRARELQLVFLSAPQENLPKKSLLSKYVKSIAEQSSSQKTTSTEHDLSVQAFTHELAGMDINALVGYPVAGIEMDLVLIHQNCTLAIDLIGFPGNLGIAFDLERYKVFERAGLSIIPISYYAWVNHKKDVLQSIKDKFTHLKEENTLSRLSVADFSSHWMKLLPINPVLADHTRKIESDLISLSQKDTLGLLGNLISQYQKLVWILNEKLCSTELTYSRYMGSSEQVLMSCIDNLAQYVKITKSIRKADNSRNLTDVQTKLRQEQSVRLEHLSQEISHSISTLEEVTYKWSHTKTHKGIAVGNVNEALLDLSELSERIEKYD
jgi:AAA domain